MSILRDDLTLGINVTHIQAVSYFLKIYSYLTFGKCNHGNHPQFLEVKYKLFT